MIYVMATIKAKAGQREKVLSELLRIRPAVLEEWSMTSGPKWATT